MQTAYGVFRAAQLDASAIHLAPHELRTGLSDVVDPPAPGSKEAGRFAAPKRGGGRLPNAGSDRGGDMSLS